MGESLGAGAVSRGGGITCEIEISICPQSAGVAPSRLRNAPRRGLGPDVDPDFDQLVSEDFEADFAVANCPSGAASSPFAYQRPQARGNLSCQASTWGQAPFRAAPESSCVAVPAETTSQVKAQQLTGEPALEDVPAEAPSGDAGEAQSQSERPAKANRLGDIVFYAFLVALVVGAFFLSGGASGGPKMIAGFSAFTVTTGSMHDVLPQGSLIVTKHVEPEELQVGDDITYMISETSSITHRIVGIEQDYADTGEPAFKTQGTMNDNPDKNLVPAVNVVGKVVFCSYPLGVAVGFVQDNWPLLIFLAAVGLVLLGVLRRILR